MKKFCCLALIIVLIFSSCGNQNNEHMKSAYASLCEGYELLSYISGIIQSSWHYGVYNSKGTLKENLYGLEAATGLSAKDIMSATASMKLNGYSIGDLSNFSECVLVCKHVIEYEYYSSAKEYIDSAKNELQEISTNYNGYEDMKNFYSTALSFYEWLDNPQGNYNQAIDTINDYKNDLKKYKNNLELEYAE